MLGNGFAANLSEHAAHALKEVFQCKNPERTSDFEVVENAVAYIVDKRKVFPVAGFCSPDE